MLRLALATFAALVTLPAASALAAACDERRVPFTLKGEGTVREADFLGGGGPLGPRRLELGAPVEGRQLKGGQTYYVERETKLKVTIHGYKFRVAPRGIFIAQCEFSGNRMYFRLLEGTVRAGGPRFSGNRSRGYVVTPEAEFLPLPGRPSFKVTRYVTDSLKRTHSRVAVRRGGSNMFVRLSSVSGKKVPCQAGQNVTIYGNGRYRNG